MKVLMLGWEFPPLFSGGLGVATHGIVKALRAHAHIRLIIPHADTTSYELNDVNIIGLNHATLQELAIEHSKFRIRHLLEDVQVVPVVLSPYHHINRILEKKEHVEERESVHTKESFTKDIQQFFSDRELYGPDVFRKINLFAETVFQLSTDGNFDVLHAHDWVTFPAAVRLKQHTGKPLVLHVHSLETDRAGNMARNEVYWLEKHALDHADKIIAVSHFTKEQMVQHYGIDPERIDVVYNGIESKEVLRRKHKINDKLVAFLGRITHQKGPDFLLETADKVVRVYPRVKFIVAGTGDQFAHLLETTAYKKLGSKFIFTGFLSREKVEEVLNMADVYFMPSVSEPFGLTALEAAQHFVPGVLSRQSGAGEVLTASLQADFWDTDKYANYIYALLKYDSLHKELASKSNEQLGSLTWENAARKIIDVYTSLQPRL